MKNILVLSFLTLTFSFVCQAKTVDDCRQLNDLSGNEQLHSIIHKIVQNDPVGDAHKYRFVFDSRGDTLPKQASHVTNRLYMYKYHLSHHCGEYTKFYCISHSNGGFHFGATCYGLPAESETEIHED